MCSDPKECSKALKRCGIEARSATSALVDWVRCQRCASWLIAGSSMGFKPTIIYLTRALAKRFHKALARWITVALSIRQRVREWEPLSFAFWQPARCHRIPALAEAAAPNPCRPDPTML